MDGIHDMGGQYGWGSVVIDPDEKVFATEWEGKAFAMGAMSGGLSGTNLDAFRHALERLHPTDYLGCLLYTSPSPRDRQKSRMPSSA